jgi:hypothetical protein
MAAKMKKKLNLPKLNPKMDVMVPKGDHLFNICFSNVSKHLGERYKQQYGE